MILPFFPWMVNLFKAPDEITSTIFTLVLLSAIAQPFFFPQSFTMPSALRAAGDANFTSDHITTIDVASTGRFSDIF